jgi:hypothetical protein
LFSGAVVRQRVNESELDTLKVIRRLRITNERLPDMSAGPLLARLRALRSAFGRAAEREQVALLRAIEGLALRKWRDLEQLHNDLLFLCAFPGSAAIRRRARSMLGSIASRVASLPRAERERADDSGIAGSVTRHVFPYPVARWLAKTSDVDIDWRNVNDTQGLDNMVSALIEPAEREAFDSGEYEVREFVELAKPEGTSSLGWIVEGIAQSGALIPRFEEAWERAEVPVVWRLGSSRASVTHNLVPGAIPRLRQGLRRPGGDVIADICAPLPSIERLSRRRAVALIAVARASLAARCREVNAMTYANPDEVWWCDLGEGVALAVIGIAVEHRLALETNTGYLLVSNGVPIGYGGVTPLFRQANTGINIFDPFRGGEAAYLWTQMLRAFHTLYGCRRFVINAYQFGAGNAEAIRSGAFWFYYRLGFRPVSARTARLAAREAARAAGDPKYRSDTPTLRALASCDLCLDLPGYEPADFFDEALLPAAGARAARQLARGGGNSRKAGARRIAAELAAELGVADFEHWPIEQREGFELLAPVFAKLPGMGAWDQADRDALAAALRAKALPQERTFALRSLHAAKAFRTLSADLQR